MRCLATLLALPHAPKAGNRRHRRRHGVATLLAVVAAGAFAALLPFAEASAAPQATQVARTDLAIDRPFAAGANISRWQGQYSGFASGGLLRWEVLPGKLGVEVFGMEAELPWPTGKRIDALGGFGVYRPLRLGQHLRLRLGAGFCTTLSTIEPALPWLPADDAVQSGAHLDVALDWALGRWISVFVQSRAFAYRGRDRAASDAMARNRLVWEPSLHADAGLAIHFGG